jgi:hypothetical protein
MSASHGGLTTWSSGIYYPSYTTLHTRVLVANKSFSIRLTLLIGRRGLDLDVLEYIRLSHLTQLAVLQPGVLDSATLGRNFHRNYFSVVPAGHICASIDFLQITRSLMRRLLDSLVSFRGDFASNGHSSQQTDQICL